MLKLTNMSTHSVDKEKFNDDSQELLSYLRRNELDGFEIAQCNRESMSWYPPGSVIGVHMNYWPICLDFFRGDSDALRKEFGSDDVWQAYYGAKTRGEFISSYREAILAAQEAGARYAVFHIAHCSLADCLTMSFSQRDLEVIDAYTDIINETLEGISCDITLLFENMWYTGLTLLDDSMAIRLLENIRCKKKGFILDIGHMMISDPFLSSYREAAEYIEKVLNERPAVLSNIKGIHINGSLTGENLQAVRRGEGICDIAGNFWERYANAYHHITRIDSHQPFADTAIQDIVGLINPDYLVFELLAKDLPTLEGYLVQQRKFCGL